jgi:hypothetical protein
VLAKCCNPSCSAAFRSLGDGQLFQLEKDSSVRTRPAQLEYFWLCEECANSMTLHISEDDSIEAVALPISLRTFPSSVAVRLIDRKGGLSLRSIGSNFSRHTRYRRRNRRGDLRDIA